MSITKLALRFAARLPDIESFDRFLFIGPHPDDIEIGAGATAAKLADMGKKVCFLICLDGRYGSETVPPDELIEIRKAEAIKSAKVLGVTDVRFLGLSDGGFYEQTELMRGIAEIVGDYGPDVVFAPDPCVTSECHADHLNVGDAARRIAYFAPYENLMHGYGAVGAPVKALAYYMTAKPTRFVKTSGYLSRQLDAIFNCHLSQFPEGSDDVNAIRLYLKLRAADFGIRSLKGTAEGFRVLGTTHMHCLPEAER